MELNIQSFGLGIKATETSAEVLGGKGAGLVMMHSAGLPVPPGFILPTTNYLPFTENPKAFMAQVKKDVKPWLARLKEHFGYMPLLSVRSGARVSCPGMMDTILNVGLDNETFPFWEEKLGNACVFDSAKRLVEMYGSVVKGIDRHVFEGQPMEESIGFYTASTGEEFPDADGQLLGSIEAVFNSWDNDRAKFYREMHDIPDDWGTAVVIQAMVFGNLNDQSCTGVLFTRNPDSGEPGVVGEYLINAQGEDVVAGIRTPDPIIQMEDWNEKVYHELMTRVTLLEQSRKDVQDVEFTVQDGSLFILQTRNAKRSARAAVRLAVDFHNEGLDLATAISRVTAKQYDLAQQSILDPSFTKEPDFTGIPACSGVVTGVIVLSAQAAIDCKEPCIMVTQETTPDDIAGMNAAKGVLTMTGGATSHAAVVARGMNKPCVVGLSVKIGNFVAGSKVSIDGATGRVWLAEVPVVDGSKNLFIQKFRQMMWSSVKCNPLGMRDEDLTGKRMARIPELPYLPADEARQVVDSLLAETSGQVILDLSGSLETHEQTFFAPFQAQGKTADAKHKELLKALEGGLTADQKARLTVLTPVKTKLKTMPLATDLESLVLAETDVVWTGAETTAVKKVLEWKFSQGIKLASFGVLTEGGYITERQLIAELLS